MCISDVDECSQVVSPCLNGGSCTNVPGSFTCNCPVGWTGDYCELGTYILYKYSSGECKNDLSASLKQLS